MNINQTKSILGYIDMKAIVYKKYGSPDRLELKEVDKPAPKKNEVLVKIHAAGLNAADLDMLRGIWIIRITGPFRPRYKILGGDIAGRIEAVGKNVTEFQPGDELFMDLSETGFGALAEYLCVPAKELVLKPANMTFEDAAAVPQAAILALQSLRNKRHIQPGQKVLINGAGGGIGTFAVQLAKYFGAEVTGVDSAGKLDMLRSIGADHVIDYKEEDYTKSGQRYDLIVDAVATRSIFDYRRTLTPRGTYVMIGGTGKAIFQAAFIGSFISLFRKRKMGILIWKPNNKEDLLFIKGLLEAGTITPVIDKVYPLHETAEAFRYLESGHHHGKIVITMDQTTNNNT